jgi:hypothetical protein
VLGALVLVACGNHARIFLGRDRPDAGIVVAQGNGSSAPPEPSRASTQQPVAAVDAGVPDAATSMAGAPAPPLPPCTAAQGDCDGDPTNGCETDLLTNVHDCGTCNANCTQPGCVCDHGQRVLRCPDGRMDCDHDLENGCEADVTSDEANCGICGRACSASAPNTRSATCTAGVCILTCTPLVLSPHADCDGNPDNGCEAALWDDPKNCGRCATTCKLCDEGVCQ